MPIYTRTGDTGTTSLFGGKRISKSDPRLDVYGSIDELNSWLGLFKDDRLTRIQRDLFAISSVLAGGTDRLDFIDRRVGEMEQWIDAMSKSLPPLTNFILPSGHMHIARSVCRRVERLAVKHRTDRAVITYLNRLSDLLFTLARYINKQQKVEEKIWSRKE